MTRLLAFEEAFTTTLISIRLPNRCAIGVVVQLKKTAVFTSVCNRFESTYLEIAVIKQLLEQSPDGCVLLTWLLLVIV